MKQVKAEIIQNRRIAPDRFKMRCGASSISRLAKPGQFLMVKCSKGPLPFLRRPFAFHSMKKNSFEILYQVVGPGTKALSQRKKGEKLDVIGPLGNGFSTDYRLQTSDFRLLVGGGIAIAPLLALAETLSKEARSNSIAIIGAGTKSHILCVNDFKRLGLKVEVATEDGSKGRKGLATDLLKKRLQTSDFRLKTLVYACGPKAMLKEVSRIAQKRGIPCEVSLEEKMGCGTGTCLGCAIKTVVGFKLVCKDGPVFNAGDILW
ncbi:dihydroorotate dehydrogenase electron transfer subunit [Omnitrophica bacterium]|nr:dihydroorotate dehydrogenase electron transfer subunit [Candidatus Omnitrophota bacterium]